MIKINDRVKFARIEESMPMASEDYHERLQTYVGQTATVVEAPNNPMGLMTVKFEDGSRFGVYAIEVEKV